jgi:hypothetical protein
MTARTRPISPRTILMTAVFVGLCVSAICLVVSFLLLLSISFNVGFLQIFAAVPYEDWRIRIIFLIALAISLLSGWLTFTSIFRFGQKSSRPK